jgi:uncharacterized protein (DUF697 family)
VLPFGTFSAVLTPVEVVMILRVYAMWGQSKMILGALLFIYVPGVVIGFVFTGIYDNPDVYVSGMSQT